MAWTNILDTGPCNVSIWQMAGGGHGTTSYYSGTLVKGQSSPTFAGYSGGLYQLTIDASGLISMACLTGSSGFTPEIRITPTFNLANIPTRFRSIYLDTAASTVGTYASRFYADSIATANVANDAHLTRASGTSVTPDPASPVLNASANIGGMYVNYSVDVTAGEMAGFIMETSLPVIFVPDETLNMAQGVVSTVSPAVYSDGSPVTPSSLQIVTGALNGIVSVSGSSLVYTPNGDFHGQDSCTFQAVVSGVTSNTATMTFLVNATACDDLGRVTRSFVSGYTASRAETHRVRRFSRRTVTANFNGALAKGRTITHVRWDCTSPWSIFMENARIIAGQRQVAVDVSYNFAGWGGLLATVTLDNGELFNQEFFYTVIDRPLYPGAVYNSANGPYVLESDV